MKEIPYTYQRDVHEIVRFIERPKARFFNEGDLPDPPLKTERKYAYPPSFFRVTHRGVFTIGWLKYLWLRIKGLSDDQILNKNL